MTDGEKRRESIFFKYSDNLGFLVKNKIITTKLKFDRTYICPICLNHFSEKSLDQSIKNPLSLEDVPPRSLGGNANILTCKSCNNSCGHELDKHLVERMLEIDSQGFLPNVEFPAKFEINGIVIQGVIKIDKEGIVQAHHMDKNNHPIKLQNYLSSTKKGTIINLQVDKKRANPINMQLAFLKTGYLLMFEKYGYSIIFEKPYDRIRQQLLNPFNLIYPLDFWFSAPYPKKIVGVPFIIEKGLEAICPIFFLRTKSSERLYGTIIPLTSKPIEEIISELKTRFKEHKSFPVRFDTMNGGVDYLTNLEAIDRMKSWIKNLAQNQNKNTIMKDTLISAFITQLQTLGTQEMVIPEGYEDRFWEWFRTKSRIFSIRRVRKSLRATSIPIRDNFCYKNTYRIAKGFKKRLFYYEGFAFSQQHDLYLKHAFNVCKWFRVSDYSPNERHNILFDYYVGVRIPLGFARRIYSEHGDYLNVQDSLLVPYFMSLNGLNGYLDYTAP
jgi:hypothetical protein